MNNHHNSTYEAIIAILDPKRGQATPVMNRALARQVKQFIAKQQQDEFKQIHFIELAVYLCLLYVAIKPPTTFSSVHGDLGGQGEWWTCRRNFRGGSKISGN